MCYGKDLDVIFELVDMESSIREKLKRTSSSDDHRVNVLLSAMLKRVQKELKLRRKTLKRKESHYVSCPKKRFKPQQDPNEMVICSSSSSEEDEDDILGLDNFFARLNEIKSV